jgi:hypothetical protein
MVGGAESSAMEVEALDATVVCAVPRGVRIPSPVIANSKVINRDSFICNSLLARNSHSEIEDGGGNRPERNRDP